MEEISRNSRWRSAIFTCNLRALYYVYISLQCCKPVTNVYRNQCNFFLLATVLVSKLCHAALQISTCTFTLPLHLWSCTQATNRKRMIVKLTKPGCLGQRYNVSGWVWAPYHTGDTFWRLCHKNCFCCVCLLLYVSHTWNAEFSVKRVLLKPEHSVCRQQQALQWS